VVSYAEPDGGGGGGVGVPEETKLIFDSRIIVFNSSLVTFIVLLRIMILCVRTQFSQCSPASLC
jgi:hypothetical protein